MSGSEAASACVQTIFLYLMLEKIVETLAASIKC